MYLAVFRRILGNYLGIIGDEKWELPERIIGRFKSVCRTAINGMRASNCTKLDFHRNTSDGFSPKHECITLAFECIIVALYMYCGYVKRHGKIF